MLKKLFNTSAVLFCLLAPTLSFADNLAAIGVSPVTADIIGKPGSTASQDLYVFNQGDSAFLFICSLEDYWYQDGKAKTAPLGTFQERQAGAWVQCTPNRKIIPAHGKEKVQILAAIPENAEGDAFTMFFAHMKPASDLKNPDSQSLQASARIGVRTTVRAMGTEKSNAEIINAKIVQEKKFQVFSAQVKNIGNTYLAGKGSLVLSNNTASILNKVDITLPFTFPTMTKAISANLIQPIPSGTYQAVLSIAGENGPSLVKEFTVKVQ